MAMFLETSGRAKLSAKYWEQTPEKGHMIFQGRFHLWTPGFGGIAITNHRSVADQIREVFLNSITPSVEMVSLMLGERIICSP